MRTVHRRHRQQPYLFVPARRYADALFVACTSCRCTHPHRLEARSPRCFASGSVAPEFGRIVIVPDVESDAELLLLADELTLLFSGWRLTAGDQAWRHFAFGDCYDAPAALALQQGLDSITAHRLKRRPEARC